MSVLTGMRVPSQDAQKRASINASIVLINNEAEFTKSFDADLNHVFVIETTHTISISPSGNPIYESETYGKDMVQDLFRRITVLALS